MIGRWKRRANHLATARLSVRRHIPWQVQVLLLLTIIALLAVAGVALFQYGMAEGRRDPHAALAMQGASEQASRLATELADARQKITTLEQQLRLEGATRETLSKQLAQLQADNGGLRDHMAFYESLLTKTDRAPPLAIDLLRVVPIAPGRYRVQATLVQGQSSQEPFKGEIDFRLTIDRAGRQEQLVWPASRLPLTVSRFTRFERDTELTPDVKVRHVEMRVYAAGSAQVKLSRSYDVKG